MWFVLLQVLLNAFGRALKDSFPPARIAALRALVATVKYYSPDEMSLRALPAVAPLCIDQLAGKVAVLLASSNDLPSSKCPSARICQTGMSASAFMGFLFVLNVLSSAVCQICIRGRECRGILVRNSDCLYMLCCYVALQRSAAQL